MMHLTIREVGWNWLFGGKFLATKRDCLRLNIALIFDILL